VLLEEPPPLSPPEHPDNIRHERTAEKIKVISRFIVLLSINAVRNF
jgi:hypothetical protein